MAAATKAGKRVGRPLGSREETGYGSDLAHLGRLRQAALTDKRLTPESYDKVSKAIRVIETVLRQFS